jgi:predicted MPP superfamily phosphohydrolase
MRPGIRTPGDAVRWLAGAARAVDRGGFGSPAGRATPQPAPGGTVDPGLDWGPARRLLEEVAAFTTSRHRLPVAGLAEPLTILQVSDAHLRWPGRWLDRLCTAVSACSADLVALTGDTVTGGWRRDVADRLLDALPRTRFGTFSVTGNWERIYDAPLAPWWAHLADRGVRVLDNQHMDLGPLVLAGVDDLHAGAFDPEAALAGAPDRPTVVLSHSPASLPHLARPGVQLVLSGHSHGGQVRLPGLGAPWLPKGTGPYVAGWYQHADTWMYVSRGLGWSLLPVRFRCPPELALVTLLPG